MNLEFLVGCKSEKDNTLEGGMRISGDTVSEVPLHRRYRNEPSRNGEVGLRRIKAAILLNQRDAAVWLRFLIFILPVLAAFVILLSIAFIGGSLVRIAGG